ncbi:hypothetical protein N431DRAFT_139848 [Stipitochalara longipes BDJ]|nr:hypothetical protein N431DRAFT_139848 [Stipitochalara longipes BDJ]
MGRMGHITGKDKGEGVARPPLLAGRQAGIIHWIWILDIGSGIGFGMGIGIPLWDRAASFMWEGERKSYSRALAFFCAFVSWDRGADGRGRE